MAPPPHNAVSEPGIGADGLEARIAVVGRDLASSLGRVLSQVPGTPSGPQALASSLGVDKVLTSRLLKATRSGDPMAVAHHVPGPEPLRRVLRAAAKKGVDAALIEAAGEAVERFEHLIRCDAGDRSALDAIISSWLPEARRDFELRRKQAAFRAMSQLRGAMVNLNPSAVLLSPSEDGERIDVVWVIGLLGLQRLRPGVKVKFTTRNMEDDHAPRRPETLAGRPYETLDEARLDEFCDSPPAILELHRAGRMIHYMLAGDAFGPGSSTDFVMVEVNRRELERLGPGAGRKTHVFAEVETPAKLLVLDVIVHRDLFAGVTPELLIFDTSGEGVASPNDPTRDVDRYDLVESIQIISESGVDSLRIAGFPRYLELLRRVFASTGWDEHEFRTYRARVEYPIYGSQVTVAFGPNGG